MPGRIKVFFSALALSLCMALLLVSPLAAAAAEWESLGPDGGDRFEVKISPLDTDTLFVIGHRGVHKSVDGGQSWISVTNRDLSHLNSILSLEFDPFDPTVIYIAGTTKGVWRSYDEGLTWEICNNGIPLKSEASDLWVPIYSLAIDSSGVIYASSRDPDDLEGIDAYWIYRSVDGGDNWEGWDSGITKTVTEFFQKPKALLSQDAEGDIWAMVHGGGVFRLEGGVWTPHNGDLPESALRGTYLEHDPNQASRLLLATEDDWVYESLDLGVTWVQMVMPSQLDGLPVLPVSYFAAIDPNNSDLIFVKTFDSYGSIEQPLFQPGLDQNDGAGVYYTFESGADGWLYRPQSVFRMTFDPSETVNDSIGIGIASKLTRTKTTYITSGGFGCVSKSIDGQVTYDFIINGVDSIETNSIFVYSDPPPSYQPIVYAGSEAGIYIAENTTDPIWKRQKPVDDLAYTWSFAQDYQDPYKVFYAIGTPAWSFPGQRGVYQADIGCLDSPDTPCPPGVQLLNDVGVWKVVTTPTDPLKIYALCQQDGILVSSDGGASWDPFNTGLPLPLSVTDIILNPSGAPLYASARESDGELSYESGLYYWPTRQETGALYSYNDQLSQWEQVDGVELGVMALEFDVANNIHYAATVQGIYRSEDNWATWEQFDRFNIYTDLAIDPGRSGGIYAGSFNGVFRALDGGLNWAPINEGLIALEVSQLGIEEDTGTVFAATIGKSAARRQPDLGPMIDIDVNSLYFEIVPVGLSSELEFVLSNIGETALNIYDVTSTHGEFSILESFPCAISPWTTLTVPVKFEPTASSQLRAMITVSSDDPDNPFVQVFAVGAGVPAIVPESDLKINGQDGPVTQDRWTPTTLDVDFLANDYLGEDVEHWIKWQTPTTTYWYVAGSGWIESVTPVVYISGYMADFSLPIDMGSNLLLGAYQFEHTVDNSVDGSLDSVWSDTVDLTVVPAVNPVPDVKVNDLDGPVIQDKWTPTMLTVDFSANDYESADVEHWIRWQTPTTTYWYVAGSGWTESGTPLVYIDGVMADFNLPIDMGSNLPLGAYQLEHTVDNIVDGVLDSVWSDSVDLTIVPVVDPVPDVKVNTQDGPVTLDRWTPTTLTVDFVSNDYLGENGEHWIKWQTPATTYWYVLGSGWVESPTPLEYASGSMSDFNLPIDLGSTLLLGDYQFEFTVDNVVNGFLDSVWTDSLDLTIVPVVDPGIQVRVNGQASPVTLDRWTPDSLTIDFFANDHQGSDVEHWIRWQTPTTTYWYVIGAGWVESATPIVATSEAMADLNIVIGLEPNLLLGDYQCEFTVDNIVDGSLDSVWSDLLDLTIVPVVDPVPDVTIDSQDGPVILDRWTPTILEVDFSANDYEGEGVEHWIRWQTPTTTYWYVAGSGWVESVTPLVYTGGNMADFNLPIDLGSTLPLGAYQCEFTVDNIVDGSLDSVWSDSLDLTIVPVVDPVPDTKVNGQDGPVTLDRYTPTTLTVDFSANDYEGESVEHWIRWQTPTTTYWYVAGSGWTESVTPLVYLSGIMADFNLPIDLGSSLPLGAYQFEFTVDDVVDGSLSSTWSDSVDLTIVPAVDPVPDLILNESHGPVSISSGQSATLNVNFTANDHQGVDGEFWLGVMTPAGQYWFVVGTGWVQSETPLIYASGTMNDFNHPLDVSFFPIGDYDFEFTADNIVDGTLDSVWSDTLSLSILSMAPGMGGILKAPAMPDIRMGSEANSDTVDRGTPITLVFSMLAGDHQGERAEYWVSATTATRQFWYVAGSGWVASEAPVVYATGQIKNFEFPLVFSKGLPSGTYQFRFDVDTNVDGTLVPEWSDTLAFAVE